MLSATLPAAGATDSAVTALKRPIASMRMVTVHTLLYSTYMHGIVSIRCHKHRTYRETLVHSYVRSTLRL